MEVPTLIRRSTRQRFAQQGWVKLPLLKHKLCLELRRSFLREVKPFEQPLLRQLTGRPEVHQLSIDGLMTNPIVNPHRLELFPHFSQIERLIMRASPLVALVEGLLGAPVAMLQCTYYESSRGTQTHLDFNPIDRSRPMIGVWIALEPIGVDAGRFYLYPRSHQLPRTPLLERFAELAWNNYRQAFIDLDSETAEAEAQSMLETLLSEAALKRETPVLGAGQAVFWTNRVLHGSVPPVSGGGARHSVLFHFIERALAEQNGLGLQ